LCRSADSGPRAGGLTGGSVSWALERTLTFMPLAVDGKIRALGAGMAKRLRAMPDLPTLQEQGIKGFECYTWNAFMAPARTPKPIIDKLNKAMNQAMADSAVFKHLQEVGVEPTPGSTPEQ